jgi:hypothetical protein
MKRFAYHILAILALLPLRAAAMRITPTIIDIAADPGQALVETISFTNDQPTAVTLAAEAVNFGRRSEETPGIPDFYPAKEVRDGNELAPWIVVDPRRFTVLSGETFKVEVNIRVPADAEPGSRFGAVIFKTGAVTEEGEPTVGLSSGAAALFFLRINGNVVDSLQLESFTSGKRLYSGLPVDLTARFNNPGTVHQRPVGKLSIVSMTGGAALDEDFNPAMQAILPGSRRRFDLKWDGDQFAFGKYRATLAVRYGPNDANLAASTEFWIVPWRTLGLLIGGPALLVLLLTRMLRRRKR